MLFNVNFISDRDTSMSSVALPLNIIPLNTLDVKELETLVPLIEENFVSLGGACSAAELLNFFYEKEGGWVITSNESPVGLFCLGTKHNDRKTLLMNAYSFNEYRKQGYGSLVETLATQAVLGIPTIKVETIIRVEDQPSLKLMSTAFPTIKPKAETCYGKEVYRYELDNISRREIRRYERTIYNKINSWAYMYVHPSRSAIPVKN